MSCSLALMGYEKNLYDEGYIWEIFLYTIAESCYKKIVVLILRK